MTHSIQRVYRITHDPATDWAGIFFSTDLEAKRAFKILMAGRTLRDRSLALSLEQVAIVIPTSRCALVDLLNAGPQALVAARQTLETAGRNL